MLKACEWIRRGGCSLKFKSNLNSNVNQYYPHPFVRERRDGMVLFFLFFVHGDFYEKLFLVWNMGRTKEDKLAHSYLVIHSNSKPL